MRQVAILSLIALLLLAACSLGAVPTATPIVSPTPAASPTATRPPAPAATRTATATATPVPPPAATATATAIPPVHLSQLAKGALTHPLGAALIADAVYTIDSGKLKAVDTRTGVVRTITPPDNTVDAYPIQELTSLAYCDQNKTLLLLDRSGSLYGWDLAARWWLERKPGGNSSAVQELLLDVACDGQTAYLLESNNGRILRRPANTWTVLLTSPSLVGGIRLAVADDLFILVGERPSRAARLLRLRNGAVSDVKVNGGMEQPSLVDAAADGLLLVDRGFRRVRLVEPGTGNAREVAAGSNADVLALDGGGAPVVLLGTDWLVTMRGALPAQLGVRLPAASAAAVTPHNLAVLAALPRWRMPVAGAQMPDIDRSLPGAPRPYRFGIHEGTDLYSSTTGVTIIKGTKVVAVADGVVTRADNDYVEATPAQMDAMLNEALTKRMTPAYIENKLGGRQVWIDHGNGWASRYIHLSGIAAGIQVGAVVKAGDVLAYAGNSGTPEAADGYTTDVHLHFEVRVGDGFLGQWISPIETRRLLSALLGVP